MKLIIDFDNMVVVLYVGCELIKQESWTHKEHGLFESIIPKDCFNFIIRKWYFQHKFIDNSDCFPCFFNREIIALQGQNIIEQALISPIPGIHIQKFHVGFYRMKPTGKGLGFLIFGGIIKDFTHFTAVFQHFIGTACSYLYISGYTYRQFAACLICWYSAVLE